MHTRRCAWIAVLIAIGIGTSADACSLCELSGKRLTLGGELERAEFAVYGWIANPRFLPQAERPGAGVTEFHVEKVFKGRPDLAATKTLEIPRYFPVLDPKNPPRYLLFGEFHKGKVDAFQGFSVRSTAVVDYLETTRTHRSGPRLDALAVYARYLDHPDPQVAEDAFLEFALSRDEEVLLAAKKVDARKLRTFLADPKLDADRLSLFAFLLGAAGQPGDAAWFSSVVANPSQQQARGIDGVLAGYMTLDPKEGWTAAWSILGDQKKGFAVRYGAMRAVRFVKNSRGAEASPQILHALKLAVADGELADLAVDDLRQGKSWELTDLILEQYGRPTHQSSIVQRGIIRYALCCPLPQARTFVTRVRSTNPETVRELEEGLKESR